MENSLTHTLRVSVSMQACKSNAFSATSNVRDESHRMNKSLVSSSSVSAENRCRGMEGILDCISFPAPGTASSSRGRGP